MNKSSADVCPKSLFNRALPVRSSNLCLHRPVRHTRLPKGAEKNQRTQQWRETGRDNQRGGVGVRNSEV